VALGLITLAQSDAVTSPNLQASDPTTWWCLLKLSSLPSPPAIRGGLGVAASAEDGRLAHPAAGLHGDATRGHTRGNPPCSAADGRVHHLQFWSTRQLHCFGVPRGSHRHPAELGKRTMSTLCAELMPLTQEAA
jgi:hypothetical protein